jgi:autotransporter-associated beta strand protein
MNTIFIKVVRSLKISCLLLCGFPLGSSLVSVQATTIYDSGGFETFLPLQNLDGQDPTPPIGNGPWAQDNGTSAAMVTAANPIEGNQSVKITRAAGATGNTRWGVLKSVVPAGLNNVVSVSFDMRVVRQANEFGPLFGIEAYDASAGARKLLGSLLLDASTGQILCHSTNSGAFTGTGTYLDIIVHHHYRLAINFTAKTCSLFADGDLVHTESFVDTNATQFTDAALATLALDATNNNAGIAYFDNYRIEHTTSQLPYLVWQGDGTTNNWDAGVSTNWFDGISDVVFTNGAEVVFDDSGSATPAVQLQGSLLPRLVRVSADQNYEFGGTGSIKGAAGLVKEGTGTLNIFNTNGYTGETEVLKGGLSIRNTTGSATGTNKVSVFPMCTVSGNGTIGGSLWVASGGVVQPGVSGPGTLTIGDQLVLDDAALKFDLGTNSDQLVAGGDLTLGGTLTITNTGGFGPGTYTLITYGGELAAGTLLVSDAPAGYDYTVSTNTPGQINLIVAPPPPPPAAPGALAVTTISTSQLDLAWSDNSTNESSFLIERSQDNTNFIQIATTGAGVTSYSDTGLSAGTTFYYRTRARNAGGDSPYSNVTSATTIPSEAVAWYEFEMTPLDSSGNNNHAVPVGTLLYGPGKRGLDAAQFDGTAFAEITRVVTTNFTVAMWLKTTNTGLASGQWYNGMGLVDGEMVGSAADWGCSVLNSKFALGIGNPDTTISTKVSINDGNWHHVAATRDSDTGMVKLYVDGVLNAFAAAPQGPRTAPNELRIGATHSTTPVFFFGSMDDLKLYDRALNPSEIAALVRLTYAQWQLDNFGCTNCPQAASKADPDGDGVGNAAEFDAGTSPTNSLSSFRIVSFAVQTNDAAVTWRAVGGRTNVVQAVTGDSQGGISPAFIDVSGPIIIGGSGDTTTNFVDVGAVDGVSRYYRIRSAK